MAGKELRAEVILAGREDGSFTQLGNKLQQMGTMINGISQKLIEFGEESVETYKDYEDGILETRSVLQSQYDNANQLDKVMSSIETHAQGWASSTIFHTDDIADAIANAAHAGWDYEEILEGIPQAMLIAQAGSMDLSEGLDYMTKLLASTGTSFEDAGGFVNEWAKAADLAATNIPEMGDALEKLGAAGRLAGSNEELFTMLSVLANVGTTGSDAGTAIRNVMARIAAPTNKAAEAMEALGLSEEEANEALADMDENSLAAYQQLQEMGFSAYDEQGNLKDFLTIFQDMNTLMAGMDEKSKNDFLKTLFGTKSFSYAMALLDAANDGSLMSIYDAILGVKDSDYAQEKADTLMSGLTGSTEILMSKWEEFKRKVGEVISGPLENVQGFVGGIVDTLNGIDPNILEGIAGSLGVIAAAGPGLFGAGVFFKIIGALGISSILPYVGLASALAGIAVALEAIKKQSFEDTFGDMDLDNSALNEYVAGVAQAFRDAYSEVDKYSDAVDTAVEKYTQTSQELSSDLLTKMITGTTLTEEDKTNIQNLAGDMTKELMTGINNSFDEAFSYMNLLFGGDTSSDEYEAAIGVLDGMYYDTVETAKQLGQELGETIGSAMDDGIITGDEYNAIMEKMKAYNEAMATVTAAETAGKMNVELNKAGQVTWDSLADFLTSTTSTYNSEEQQNWETHLDEMGQMEYWYQQAIEKGIVNPVTGNPYTEWDWQQYEQTQNDNYEKQRAAREASYKEVEQRALEAVLQNQETPMLDAWNYLLQDPSLYNLDEIKNNPELEAGLRALNENSEFLYDGLSAYAALNGIDIGTVYRNMSSLVQMLNEGNYTDSVMDEYNAEGATQTPETENENQSGISFSGPIADFFSGLFGGTAHAEESVTHGAAVTQPTEAEVTYKSNAAETRSEAETLFSSEITQNVSVTDNGSASSVRSSIESQFSSTITQNVTVRRSGISGNIMGFAEGGRATEASIFGEAGAEWAIPEQHTERTAELLASAAQASGFSWGELLTRNGGLNAGSSGATTIVYSPTINTSGGSDGIEKALRDDKERLDKWWRERNMVQANAAYA